MNNHTQQIVNKAWNFAHVLRDDGLSYMAYTEQITFLLFLKMADEQTKPPYCRKAIVPKGHDWPSLLAKEGDGLEAHYRHVFEHLSGQPGMLGAIFKKAKPEIQNPALLRRLIVDLIDKEQWLSMQADVKGDIYEGLLAKSAEESPKGAGQYFTPRELIRAIVDVMQPTPDETICDPACGTGGFLLAAHDYVIRQHGKTLDPDQKRHLRKGLVRGWELVPNTARLAVMNLYLHGIDGRPLPDLVGVGQPRQRPWRAVQHGPDQPALRQEVEHHHRDRRGGLGEGGHGLRAHRLLDDHEEQAVELPPARQDAAEDQRQVRHRRV